MSSKPHVKKYAASALLELARPTECGDLQQQQQHTSWLTHTRKTKWQPCYVILAKECIYVFKNKNSSEPQSAALISTLECAKSNGTEDIDDEDVCFNVRFEDANKHSLIFACDVDKTRQKWIEAITNEILKVKNPSADSAYFSGGSNGSFKKENENNYHEIDESEVTTTVVGNKQEKQDESKQHKKGAINTGTAANAYAGPPLCTMTRQPTSIQPVSDCEESGFINVGIHSSPTTRLKTPYTQQKGVGNDETQRMQCLKPPITESNTEADCGENSQNIYEITEDDFAINLNVSPVNELIRQNNSRSASENGAARQKIKPIVLPKPIVRRQTDPQRTQMTTKSSSTQPACANLDSGHLIVDVSSSSTEVKTLYERRGGVQHEDKPVPNLTLDTTVTSSNSDSGEEYPIYENLTFRKVFERDEYMFSSRVHHKKLMSTPVGTFFVRPGKRTKYVLVIRTEDGTIQLPILEKNGFFYLTEDVVFSSLDHLVTCYSSTNVPSTKFMDTLKRGYKSSS